jgi:UDPglucose 6-dehydrogenase/GDP-mannose 6-dehydrogenase
VRVAIFGAGYVGLVTGVGLAAAGHDVVCAELDAERVLSINRGISPLREPGLEELLREQLRLGRFRATGDPKDALSGSRVSILAVGTPTRAGRIDLAALLRAAGEIGAALPGLPSPHVVAVKSTVVPGTTQGPVREALERSSGLRLGDFGLAANPEFLREGSALSDFRAPDRILVGAADPGAEEALRELYAPFDAPLLVTSPPEAELAKYASNALLATLVSFSNELARLCESLPGLDVEAVLGALHLDRRLSPREGSRRLSPGLLDYLRAGCGFGGSCLPKDLEALRGLARERGLATPLLRAVARVNRERPAQVVRLLEQELGSLAGREIALLGVAFKPGTDDTRESPALLLAAELSRRGARVRSFDPAAGGGPGARPSLAEALRGADAALLATAWPEFHAADWDALAGLMRTPLLLDGRGALRGAALPRHLRYRAVGTSVAGAGASVPAAGRAVPA